MCRMTSLIAQRKNHQDAVDELQSQQNAMVWRVLNLIAKEKFDGDSEFYYQHESAVNVLTGTHLWPQVFTDFQIEDDQIVASGVYYGSRGYCDTETVRFPSLWLRCSDAGVIAAVQVAWDRFKAQRKAREEAVAREAEEKERADFERLQKKFGVNEKSG